MHATVRNFRGPDVAAALSSVKDALGPEAIILATREVGGGLFRRPEIEVTAALSIEPVEQPAAGQKSRAVAAPVESLPEPRNMRLERAVGPDAAFSAELSALKRELDDARREMRVVCLRTRAEREMNLSPAAAEVFGWLSHRGVEEGLAEEMVRQALFDGARSQTLMSAVRDLVAGRLLPSRAPWMPDRRRVLALVGPTGVGKTTTVAKIAARALVESGLKVALITVDTYRVGASEQLARYGAIMKVPTFVARDRPELEAAITSARDADLVLIDTAGRAVDEAVARQAEMLRAMPGVELYLVLSAATGARELAGAAERYRRLTPERLIFSKVDEAVAPGSVLSAAIRIGRPAACVTDGQRVPEDIHAVTSEDLCELVLGSWETTAATAARRK
jgi:flagellar biosynthesis protein FlhF